MSIVQIPSVAHCQLWRVDLDVVPGPEAAACLSDEEWERAHRFVFARDRHRFIAAHSALRGALSAHTGIPGAFLDFAHGAFGKPRLVDPVGVRFNLSHSQSVGLIAISMDSEVGVDVELLRHLPDAEALAEAHFTDAERRALKAVSPDERDRAFLRCWTRKEACLKATGMGLSADTRGFEVGLDGDAREVQVAGDGSLVRLALSSFDGGQGVVCAVARILAVEAIAPRPMMQESELYA
ncbi:4'-phosphopantetheinyl transferase family protein [Variovorax sp. GT1P44]|uniref:4'-phosphopantetheinyl transferase family protein n=1 Tax=Variovorax sp. GT1P44 TaxID=3443742 RepID=UPI003F47DA92